MYNVYIITVIIILYIIAYNAIIVEGQDANYIGILHSILVEIVLGPYNHPEDIFQ